MSLLLPKFIEFITEIQTTLMIYERFMRLSCPDCSANYLISSASLGEEGRRVRCAKCAYEWFQEPDDFIQQEFTSEEGDVYEEEEQPYEPELPEEVSEEPFVSEDYTFVEPDAALDEDIPDSVKPDLKNSNVPAFAEDVLRTPASLQAKMAGYFGALVLFGAFLFGGIVFKQSIVSLWPASAAIYELADMPVEFKGQNLVMESLSAQVKKESDGRDVLYLQGRIVNLTESIQQVPPLLARLRSTNGEDGESWSIDAPLKTLGPGESFTFKSDYPAVPRGVGSVNLTFSPIVLL